MSIVTLEEEIIDINVRLNQTMRQWFLRTSSGAALKFQRPGYLLQDWITIFSVVWLVVGNSEGKERFCS